jgi:hypothetical protein
MTDKTRERVLETGRRLGLPDWWLEKLPEISELPGSSGTVDYGEDAFLTWKRQEMLVRTRRLDEIDWDLVAEALEGAAASDGPRWWDSAVDEIMFILLWPKRTYYLHVQLGMAVSHLEGCLEDSPATRLLVDLRRSWWLAANRVEGFDDSIAVQGFNAGDPAADACPWADVDALIQAAKTRLEEDGRRFR